MVEMSREEQAARLAARLAELQGEVESIRRRLGEFEKECGVLVAELQRLAPSERRRASRRSIRLPVEMGDARGWTLNLSPSGVYFETTRAPAQESSIQFTIAWNDPPQPRRLECEGRVVRVDRRSSMPGVAVAITNSRWAEEGSGSPPPP